MGGGGGGSLQGRYCVGDMAVAKEYSEMCLPSVHVCGEARNIFQVAPSALDLNFVARE